MSTFQHGLVAGLQEARNTQYIWRGIQLEACFEWPCCQVKGFVLYPIDTSNTWSWCWGGKGFPLPLMLRIPFAWILQMKVTKSRLAKEKTDLTRYIQESSQRNVTHGGGKISWLIHHLTQFPSGASGKEPACQCRKHDMGLIAGLGRSPGGVFLPGEPHGQRSLVGYGL